MHWILIIMLSAGGSDGGVAMQTISGFSSAKACDAAIHQFPRTVVENGAWKGWDPIRTICVEVK